MGRSAGPNDDSGSYVTARPAGASDPWTAQGGRAAQRRRPEERHLRYRLIVGLALVSFIADNAMRAK
ncbi:hypothetical protein HNR10_002819 [Nocardiopsis aegyptia]|uniref:Uncharacterized protein n=1 Tax=Nocardiopsis aegyptia TaxID=220378 RepID=A0A7Z0JA49_9ACTN|nr:hypothetical protein [Nocardiopsis aegyptia]